MGATQLEEGTEACSFIYSSPAFLVDTVFLSCTNVIEPHRRSPEVQSLPSFFPPRERGNNKYVIHLATKFVFRRSSFRQLRSDFTPFYWCAVERLSVIEENTEHHIWVVSLSSDNLLIPM